MKKVGNRGVRGREQETVYFVIPIQTFTVLLLIFTVLLLPYF